MKISAENGLQGKPGRKIVIVII